MTPAAWLDRAAFGLALAALAWGPLAQGAVFAPGMEVLALLGGGALACTALAWSAGSPRRAARPVWWWLGAVWLGWVWLSVAWSADVGAALQWARVWTGAVGTALALHLQTAGSARRTRAAVAVLLAVAGLAVAAGLLQAGGLTLPGLRMIAGAGDLFLTGFYVYPSHFSGLLAVLAAVAGTALLFGRPGPAGGPLVLLALGLQVVNWRTDGGSLPGAVVAALVPFVAWLWGRRPALAAALTVGGASFAVTGVLLLATAPGRAVFDEVRAPLGFRSQTLDGFLAGRRAIYRSSLKLLRDHPVLGVGVGQYATEIQAYRPPTRDRDILDEWQVNYAHGDGLLVGGELGLVGLGLFASWLALAARPLPGAGPSAAWPVAWIATLVALGLCGLYDAHLSAIPGTMTVAFGLSALVWPTREGGPPAGEAGGPSSSGPSGGQ